MRYIENVACGDYEGTSPHSERTTNGPAPARAIPAAVACMYESYAEVRAVARRLEISGGSSSFWVANWVVRNAITMTPGLVMTSPVRRLRQRS
jgi:hypothetical protein